MREEGVKIIGSYGENSVRPGGGENCEKDWFGWNEEGSLSKVGSG